MNPTLQLILRVVAAHSHCSECDIRLGVDDKAVEARKAFLWLGAQLTEHEISAIGLFVGRPAKLANAMLHAVTKARDTTPMLAEWLDELAVECLAETQVRLQVGRIVEDADPTSIARQVVAGRGLSVGAVHLQHLASAYLGVLDQLTVLQATAPKPARSNHDAAVATVIAATRALETARYTSGERNARETLDRALADLIKQHPTPPAGPLRAKPAKEPVHGYATH